MMRCAYGLIVVMSLVGGQGCDGQEPIVEPDLTGLDIRVTYDVPLDQLALSVTNDRSENLGQASVPQPPRPLADDGESVVIVLSDKLGGNVVIVRVDGLNEESITATGRKAVELRINELRVVELHLEEPEPCGGEVCAIGQRCDGERCVCDDQSCSGCCNAEGECQTGRDPEACGNDGALCQACPSGDSCDEGACSGCTSTCEGCCEGSICLESTLESCGVGGVACDRCNELAADTCSDEGECLCGAELACATGQRCVSGMCVCDEVSCAGGCCNGSTCEIRSVETCGSGGSTCSVCDPDFADTCSSDGACRCGDSDPCAPGFHCNSGVCVCDALSCPDGCCSELGCQPATTGTCGVAGAPCVTCDSLTSDTCSSAGECACGSDPSCVSGQHCTSSRCVCDALSCPEGCCSGETCRTSSVSNCGTSGAACEVCSLDNATETCGDGTCEIASCDGDYYDCNGTDSDGCETLLGVDAHCSSCTDACSFPERCLSGTCGCPTGCTCVENDCSGGCTCEPGCHCSMRCPFDEDCDIDCGGVGTECVINANTAHDIKDFLCEDGAHCVLDFTEAHHMKDSVVCQNSGTSCEIDCTGSDECEVDCVDDAECILTCTVSHCYFQNCSVTEEDCGGGVSVCNRSCP